MIEANGSSILLYRLEPGRRFARHQHPFPELGVVLAGRGRVLYASEERALREGDSFYVPSGTQHGFEVDPEGPVVMVNVTVPAGPERSGPPASEVVHRAINAARRTADTR